MNLDTTNKSLEVVLGGAATTNQLDFITSYADYNGTLFTPGANDGTTNDTTAVTIVSAPAASTYRTVKFISVYNNDTAAADVTIQLNNNSTTRVILTVTLSAGEQLVHENGQWKILNTSGETKVTTPSSDHGLLSGLSDDDHSQYALLTGRAGDTYNVEEIRALNSNGLGLYDDAGNGIFVEDGGSVGIGTNAPNSALEIAGDLTLDSPNGLYLGGTAAANYLDDYEKGTYTVTCTPATSGSVTLDSAFDTLSYVKIGGWVHVQGYVRVSSVSSPSGIIEFSLPFTSASLSELSGRSAGSVIYYLLNLDDGHSQCNVFVPVNNTAFRLFQSGDNISWEQFGNGTNTLTGNEQFRFGFSYRTA